MNYQKYTISEIFKQVEQTYIIRLVPVEGKILEFQPGQYVYLKSPTFLPDEEHPFSISSSPTNKDYLEFCVKVYGDWTKKLVQAKQGDVFEVSEPLGSFIWDSSLNNVVFLLGGIGISPIISMLRYIADKGEQPAITMIYGNRTPDTIVYAQELKEFKAKIESLEVIDVFSHIPPEHPWKGYRGFVTPEIIKETVDLESNPTFFVIGPPIFIEKMKNILAKFGVTRERVKEELLITHP